MNQMNFPTNVKIIISAMQRAGHQTIVVGGCVRDMVMGIEPHDWDMATSATPEQIIAVCDSKGFHVVPTGIQHGTVTVFIDNTGYEITTFRSDGNYDDGRRPNSVSFVASLNEDLARRDFTINAMAHDGETLFDPFGGMRDISHGFVRCVGNADDRIHDDALRMMRAYRFASRFGFDIAQSTRDAIVRNTNRIVMISSERFVSEFIKTIMGNHPEVCDSVIFHGMVDTFIGCGFEANNVDFGKLTMLPQSIQIRMAYVMMSQGNDVEEILRHLHLSVLDIRAITRIVDAVCSNVHKSDIVNMRRHMGNFGMTAVWCALLIAQIYGDVTQAKINYNAIVMNDDPINIGQLAINGDDIIAAGITGQNVGRVLRYLMEIVTANPGANTRVNLLNIVYDR
jgi:tRNA nucleotidyltransferase (CCA-adding enzyme)